MRSAFTQAKRSAVPGSERALRVWVTVVTVVTSDDKARQKGRRLHNNPTRWTPPPFFYP